MVQAKMAQFRFYGLGNPKNYPAVTFEQNANGTTIFPWTDNLFEGYGNIIKVGIQTLPGVKFSFGTGDLSNPANSIIIDYTFHPEQFQKVLVYQDFCVLLLNVLPILLFFPLMP